MAKPIWPAALVLVSPGRRADLMGYETMSNKTKKAAKAASVRGAMFADVGNEYDDQARAFLVETGARISARYLGELPVDWDNGREHCAYAVTITSAAGRMRIRFYDSAKNTDDGKRVIRAYDVLSCLTKSEPGTFDDFCAEYGFFQMESGADYRKAVKTWRACVREYAGVCRVWPDAAMREALADIY